jgi:hypothetical protein
LAAAKERAAKRRTKELKRVHCACAAWHLAQHGTMAANGPAGLAVKAALASVRRGA